MSSLLIKRFLFFYLTSFVLATALYYILWVIMPNHDVFGIFFRMFLYHKEHPVNFIAIPCFFFGIVATLFANKFLRQTLIKQILLTFLIIVMTVIVSSPFGGMLWHYYDMKAVFFPKNWVVKMTSLGFKWGLKMGWMIIGLSIPYNFICSLGSYFLIKKGSALFNLK